MCTTQISLSVCAGFNRGNLVVEGGKRMVRGHIAEAFHSIPEGKDQLGFTLNRGMQMLVASACETCSGVFEDGIQTKVRLGLGG